MAWPGIETINLDLCVEIKNYIATSDNRFLHREEKKQANFLSRLVLDELRRYILG